MIPEPAIEAAANALMDAQECGHPMTMDTPECDEHGEPFTDIDAMEVYGYLTLTGICSVAKQQAQAALTAALPHIRTQIATDIRAHATEIADTRLHTKGAIPYIAGAHGAADIAEKGNQK